MADYNMNQKYKSAMAQARILFDRGVIDIRDIISIENKLADKYGFAIGSIYREIDLINVTFRANIILGKEVI